MNRGLKAIQLPTESLRKFQLLGEQLQESVRPQFQAISDMVRSVQASWSKLAGTFQQNLVSPLSLGIPEKRAAIKQLSNEKGSTASNVLKEIIAKPGSSAKQLGKQTACNSECNSDCKIGMKLESHTACNSEYHCQTACDSECN